MMAAVCLLLLIASAATAPATDEGTAAFCQHASSSSSSSAAADYPSTSTSPNLPFVWDAHYNAVSGLVELTAASRKPCAFNRARWKEACSRFPQYSKQLAGCDDGKVLLDVPEAVPVVGQSPENIYDEVEDALPLERLFGGQMACVYSRRGKPVYQMLSQPVQGRKLWLMMGAFQVRCPEPREFVVVNGSRLIASRNPVAWDSVALRRLDGTGRFKEGPVSTAAKASSGSATTASFSVCSAAEATYADHRKRPVGDPLDLPRPTVTSTKRSSRRRLSVCAVANSASTSSRSNSRTLLVEWLEYHLSVGVEHLYLYDMSRRRTGQRLADLLTDYVAAGVVTIVPWPYQSCVDGMAAEKSVQWMHDERQYAVTFQPPREIARHAAMASCYARYRATSTYIAHIDVDEFITLDNRPAKGARARAGAGEGASAGSSHNDMRRKKGSALKTEVFVNSTSLADFADAVFSSRPKAVAIRFSPVLFEDCSSADKPWARATASASTSDGGGGAGGKSGKGSKSTSPLPRMGGALSGNGVHFGHHDGKLLMRTDAVGLFHVQAVTMVERPWSDKDVFVPHLDRAAVYQFKRSPEVSGVVWDAEKLPFSAYTKPQAAALCHYHEGADRLKETSHRIPSKSKERRRNAATYARASRAVLAAVERKVKQLMRMD